MCVDLLCMHDFMPTPLGRRPYVDAENLSVEQALISFEGTSHPDGISRYHESLSVQVRPQS